MDIETRGGKRLLRKRKPARPSGWLVVPLVALALLFTAALAVRGQNEARRAAQSVAQDGEGTQVITWTPEDFAALYGHTTWPVELLEEPAATTTPPADDLPTWSEDDLELIAQTVWAEARGVRTRKEQAAVVWCILNRLDTGRWGDSIREVVTAPYQFAWTEDRPVVPELVELTEDVLMRWRAEKTGEKDVGRVLPAEYLFFEGDEWAIANHFRIAYKDTSAEWGWTLPDPYGEG